VRGAAASPFAKCKPPGQSHAYRAGLWNNPCKLARLSVQTGLSTTTKPTLQVVEIFETRKCKRSYFFLPASAQRKSENKNTNLPTCDSEDWSFRIPAFRRWQRGIAKTHVCGLPISENVRCSISNLRRAHSRSPKTQVFGFPPSERRSAEI
jgi:hypothetical protein